MERNAEDTDSDTNKPEESEGKLQNPVMEKLRDIQVQIEGLHEDIRFSVAPRFLEVSIETNDLVELAIELWRLDYRVNKILPTVPEDQRESISNSVQKLKRYLDKNDIEILDHTGQKYDDGQNLEVLAVETDKTIQEPRIKETKEPTILCKGQVVHIGKVIIVDKE